MAPILKRIGIGFVAATVIVFAIGFLLPRTFTISRSVVIKATPEKIHRYTGNLENWPQWTPWFKADPAVKVAYGSMTTGVGATQEWDGDSGDGILEFTRSDPTWGVEYDMVLDGGSFPSVCRIRYHDTGDGNTEVTWEMTGDNGYNILGRFMGLMMGPMVGPMYEEGLARLKLVTEKDDSTRSVTHGTESEG